MMKMKTLIWYASTDGEAYWQVRLGEVETMDLQTMDDQRLWEYKDGDEAFIWYLSKKRHP